MKCLLAGLVLAFVPMGASGCSCDTNDTLLKAMQAAIPYPETFAAYALAQSESFDQDFEDCATKVVAQFDKYIKEQEDLCYDTFTDPDFLNGCLGEDLAPFRALRSDVVALRDLLPIQSAAQWNNHPLNQVLIFQKQGDPQFAARNLAAINVVSGVLTCKDCSFLGL